ncbi:MAG: hypothetical protein ACI9N1_003230 [Flavobacteriales bacterium]
MDEFPIGTASNGFVNTVFMFGLSPTRILSYWQ